MSHYQVPATIEEEKSQLARAIEASKREMERSDSTSGSRAQPSHLYDRATMVREWEERFGTKIFREGSEQEFMRWWAFKKGEPFEAVEEDEQEKGDEPAAEPVTRKRKARASAADKKTKRAKRS
jgi:hypothetical protein